MVQISSGLLSYFNNSKTRAAVELLLTKKRPSIPDDVPWADVPNYFRALRAAHQIQSDYAILLHEIWNAVWKPLPKSWAAEKPYEQIDDGLLDPRTILDQEYALRGFDNGKLRCELLVYADNESGIQVGFNVLQNNKSKFNSGVTKELKGTGWERDDVTMWSPSGLVPIQNDLNLAPLEPFIDAAITVIKDVGKL